MSFSTEVATYEMKLGLYESRPMSCPLPMLNKSKSPCHISRKLMLNIFRTYYLAVLLYESENWTVMPSGKLSLFLAVFLI